MKSLTPHKKRLAGFTLIEMAIVLLISGILMSAGLALFMGKMAAAQVEVTQKRQEAIKQALINYLGQYKRLPCPGDSTTGVEVRSASAPTPPCPSYSGIVPYQTLGLDRAVALDGWENFIAYVVSPSPIAAVLPATIPPAPIWTTAWLYSYSTTPSTSPCTPTTCSNIPIPPTGPIPANPAFWPSTSTGGITVKDGNGIAIADPTKATGAAVVLISYGKNGFGAVNIKGGTNNSTAAGTDERQNINPTSGVPTTVKRDTTNSTTGNGPFDDIVMILSANDLIGPLVANGTLQSSSAQAALSQANDIVMGSIVAKKTPYSYCPDTCPPTPIAYSSNYTIPPSPPNPLSPTFSTNVTAWGVTYSSGLAATIDAINPASSTQIAYTLAAGDGTTKIVLIGELRGILTRGAGF